MTDTLPGGTFEAVSETTKYTISVSRRTAMPRHRPRSLSALTTIITFILLSIPGVLLYSCASTHPGSGAAGSGGDTVTVSAGSETAYQTYYRTLTTSITVKSRLAYMAGYLHGTGQLSDTDYRNVLAAGKRVDDALHTAIDATTSALAVVHAGRVLTDSQDRDVAAKVQAASDILAQLASYLGPKGAGAGAGAGSGGGTRK